MTHLPSADFLTRLKQRDPEAFRQLVETRKDRVFNLCMSYLRQRQDAEDAAQEVFLKVHRGIEGFREEAEFDTWIYRVAVTTSLDFLRKRKRKQPWSLFHGIGASPGGGSGPLEGESGLDGIDLAERSGQVPDLVESNHPESALQDKQRTHALTEAIHSLPDNQRSAILLHYMEELSYEEVSEALGVSFSAVESLLFRARRTLRNQLATHPLFTSESEKNPIHPVHRHEP